MDSIIKIEFPKEFFSVQDTLECDQIFRFLPYKNGFKVFSLNKCAYCYESGDNSIIECNSFDKEYFINFFDLSRDYNKIFSAAVGENIKILSDAANAGKGIRILNQDRTEMLFSFIVSQNNNIPRIKGIIEKLCYSLGEKSEFLGEEYFSFPTPKKMAEKDVEFYKSIGLGYRAEYIRRLAEYITLGKINVESFNALDTKELKKSLVAIHGVGQKVADCVALFGFNRSDSFPVDTWIEKVYIEDFKGNIKDRAKIAEYFVQRFKQNSGFYQQYLFHYKRIKEKSTLK